MHRWGVKVCGERSVRKHLFEKKSTYLELASVLPLEWMALAAGYSYDDRLVSLLTLNRILRAGESVCI